MRELKRILKYRRPRFIYHDHLNPSIWGDDCQMRKTVAHALTMATWSYIAYMHTLGLPLPDEAIIDAFVHGSSTNYYWDDTSDIDICIVADLSHIHKAYPGLNVPEIIKNAKGGWMHKHKTRICGRGIDFEVVDSNTEPQFQDGMYKPGSGYSLRYERWIRRPIMLGASQIRKMRYDARKIFHENRRTYREIIKQKQPTADVENFMQRMIAERNQTFYDHPQQPVTAQTMAYRMFRRCGMLASLRVHARKFRSQKFNM